MTQAEQAVRPGQNVVWDLCCAVIEAYPGAVGPVMALVSTAVRLATCLTPEQRDFVARHLRREADYLDAPTH